MNQKLGMCVCLCAGVVAAVLVTMPLRAKAGDDAPTKKVKVGLVKSLFKDMPEAVVQIVMRPFKAFLEAQTGSTGEIVLSGDAETLGQQLTDDKVQIGVFHGYEFAWAKQKNPQLKVIVLAVNENPVQHALLVVRKDCTAESCEDLKGQKLAVPRLTREHCKLFLENRCVKAGTAPDKFYGEVTAPLDSEDALDCVVDGTAQATVVDGMALEAYKANKPGRYKQLKTLLQSEPFPSAVIAYNPGAAPEAAVARFRQGLIAARKTTDGKKLLQMCRITSFEEMPTDYEQLFADIAKAYPPPSPPK
jgi:ABC-type phosphate/phosphonate transport system substrate-binding protein